MVISSSFFVSTAKKLLLYFAVMFWSVSAITQAIATKQLRNSSIPYHPAEYRCNDNGSSWCVGAHVYLAPLLFLLATLPSSFTTNIVLSTSSRERRRQCIQPVLAIVLFARLFIYSAATVFYPFTTELIFEIRPIHNISD